MKKQEEIIKLVQINDDWVVGIRRDVLKIIQHSSTKLWGEELGKSWGYCPECLEIPSMRGYKIKCISSEYSKHYSTNLAVLESTLDTVLKKWGTSLAKIRKKDEENAGQEVIVEDTDIKVVATGEVLENGDEVVLILISKQLLNCIKGGNEWGLWGGKFTRNWGVDVENYMTSPRINLIHPARIVEGLGINPVDFRMDFTFIQSRKSLNAIKSGVKSVVQEALKQGILEPMVV